MRSPGWQRRAACAETGPELFFGPDDEMPGDQQARETAAKRVCARCPVRRECLEYGESLGADGRRHGVWGGLGELDRQRYRRSQGQARRRGQERTAAA